MKYRILLADDHEVVRSGIRNALNDLNEFEIVAEVEDGTNLKRRLPLDLPDLLLIDVDMPAFQPIADIQAFKLRYPKLKILVVSAHDDDVYVQGLLGAGVNGYHMKDQPLDDLRLAVRRVMEGERWVTSRLLDKLISRPVVEKPLPSLTDRQRDILRLLQQGLDNQSIARQIGLSVKTVENHLTRIYRQLGVQSRLEAVNVMMTHPDLQAVRKEIPFSDKELNSSPSFSHDKIDVSEKRTVLIVDDNSRYRQMLHRTLATVNPLGRFYEASNINEAVDATKKNQPHLALIDVVLGSESGIDCVRALADLLPSMRIVLITAYPDREFHRIGLEAGAAALVDKKDLNADVLRQILADV